MKPACLILPFTAALAILPGAAEAQAPKPEPVRFEARRLADEGQRRFEAGDYRGAIERLREAHAKFAAPTIELALAEAHEKLGELLEARSFYERLAGAELERAAPAEFQEARTSAKSALDRLEGVIPRLVVELVGPAPPVLSLALDGKAVQASPRPIRVNPGRHTLSIEMSGQPTEKRTLELKEGETRRIQLRWARLPDPDAPPTPAPSAAPEPPARSFVAPAIAFGAAGAGLVLGAVTGGTAIARMEGFRQQCGPELRCPESLSGDLDGARTAGHVSTVGFAVAGAGAALGTLLLVLPSRKAGPASVAVGPAGVVVTGTF
jgi:hypothetical protein